MSVRLFMKSGSYVEIVGTTKLAFGSYKQVGSPVEDLRWLAESLSNIKRFGGTSDVSVLEHSLAVSAIAEYAYPKLMSQPDVDPEYFKVSPEFLVVHGLVHDLHEALFGDIPTPVKAFLGHEAFGVFELAAKEGVYQLVAQAVGATNTCISRATITIADKALQPHDEAAMLIEATQLPRVQRDFVFDRADVEYDSVGANTFQVYYPRLSREYLLNEYIERLGRTFLSSTGGKQP